MTQYIPQDRGFIGRVVLLVAALIALNAIWDINIFEFLRTEPAQEIIQPISNFLKDAWAWLDEVVRKLVSK